MGFNTTHIRDAFVTDDDDVDDDADNSDDKERYGSFHQGTGHYIMIPSHRPQPNIAWDVEEPCIFSSSFFLVSSHSTCPARRHFPFPSIFLKPSFIYSFCLFFFPVCLFPPFVFTGMALISGSLTTRLIPTFSNARVRNTPILLAVYFYSHIFVYGIFFVFLLV